MIQDILLRHADSRNAPAALLAELVAALRPENPARVEQAANLVLSLCHVLDTQPQARAVLRPALVS
ncbi:MAG TPA: hypothetical protein PKW44_06110, partial [Methylophilaceae bacterium]|nr:hypothetical protein [Methylophilaceae bacterium]